MEELEQILLAHAKRYPQMQPTDAVKLIYQNEFGGGHLIRDVQACLNYLRREYESIEKDAAAPLYECIGNGIVRVNLAAVKEADLERLGQAFIRSAAEHKGNLNSFQEKLTVLCAVTAKGAFSFGTEVLQRYLTNMRKQAFRRSPTVRSTGKPTNLPTASFPANTKYMPNGAKQGRGPSQ